MSNLHVIYINVCELITKYKILIIINMCDYLYTFCCTIFFFYLEVNINFANI